jgi:hypothetical protein
MENEVSTPESAETQTPESAEPATQSTFSGEVKAPVENVNAAVKPAEYPEGFDAKTFNMQTGEIKKDGVLERFQELTKNAEDFEKQSKDMRKIISKGKAFEDAQEYINKYNAPEGLEKYYDRDNADNADITEVIDTLANGAKQQGLNEEQFNFVLDNMNNAMVKAGVFDPRTSEQVQLDTQDWIAEENKKLSDNPLQAKAIVDANVQFVKDNNIFSDAEKEVLVSKLLDSGAIGVSAMNKIRTLFGGKGQDIPTVELRDTGLASDASLAEEFYNSTTPGSRRQEIVKQREEAGRFGGLPLPQSR